MSGLALDPLAAFRLDGGVALVIDGALLLLDSDAGSFMTGTSIVVDGGCSPVELGRSRSAPVRAVAGAAPTGRPPRVAPRP